MIKVLWISEKTHRSSIYQCWRALEKAPGLRLVDEFSRHGYPVPLNAAGQDDCEIGRLCADCALENGLSFWICGDQLFKGAALNALQIAELLA